MNVFVLDNYDSFTFNLVQYLGELGAAIDVRRNDEIDVEGVALLRPEAVVISPGPGGPSQAGISLDLVRWCASSQMPLLGVCLGHQAIAQAFGARIAPAPAVMHGKTSLVHHDGQGVLCGLPDPFEAMRYHSLAVEASSVPAELTISASTSDGVVMGLRHVRHPIEGVQFHPESVLTGAGKELVENFVTRRR